MNSMTCDLPESHRETLSALEQFQSEGVVSTLPSPQKLASLHRYFVKRFVDSDPQHTTQKHKTLIDSGYWNTSRSFPCPNGGSALLIRTLSEWIEDSRRLLEEGDGGHIYTRCDNALLASSGRLQSYSDRVRMMLPILLSTLGNPTADGGHLVMPKNRAETLTDYFLESLDLNSRSVMRFSMPEYDEEETEEEQEERRAENALKHSSFPKLLDGFRRMKFAAKDEDGSDLVVDRLLMSIDSLIFESLVYYSYKKSLSEVKRRKKSLRMKVNEVHLASDQALFEVLRQELDRMYTSVERMCKYLSSDGLPEKAGYTPFIISTLNEGNESERPAKDDPVQKALFAVLDIDRGILGVNRVRSRGLPEVLLLPGNAVACYDREGDILLLPHSAITERTFEHMVNAFASFRWRCDSNAKLLNVWAEIMEYRGSSPMFELEPSFRCAYSSWAYCSTKGEDITDDRAKALGEILAQEGEFARCPL